MEENTNIFENTDNTPVAEPPASVEVVGVKFKNAGKMYYFSPEGRRFAVDDKVIVRTARGVELGFISQANKTVPAKEIVAPLCPVLRSASVEDIQRWESNKQLEKTAFETCVKLISKHKLDMKPVSYTHLVCTVSVCIFPGSLHIGAVHRFKYAFLLIEKLLP